MLNLFLALAPVLNWLYGDWSMPVNGVISFTPNSGEANIEYSIYGNTINNILFKKNNEAVIYGDSFSDSLYITYRFANDTLKIHNKTYYFGESEAEYTLYAKSIDNDIENVYFISTTPLNIKNYSNSSLIQNVDTTHIYKKYVVLRREADKLLKK